MEENRKDDLVPVIDKETGEIIGIGALTEAKEDENTPAALLARYTDIDLEISKVVIEQDDFIKANKEIFDKLEEFRAKIQQFEEEQSKVKEDLKQAMREANIPQEIGVRFTAKYTAPYTKKNFDTKKFYEDYTPDTAMYKKYVGVTNVSDSIKISETKKK